MRVHLTVNVTESERYLIAACFRKWGIHFPARARALPAGIASLKAPKRRRRRATRDMVRRYVTGAFYQAVRDHLEDAAPRTKTAYRRINARIDAALATAAAEAYPVAGERNRRLFG